MAVRMSSTKLFEQQLMAAEYCDEAAWHYREASRHQRLGNHGEVARHRHLAHLHLREAVEQALAVSAHLAPAPAVPGRPS
jgi:hypothetical protein